MIYSIEEFDKQKTRVMKYIVFKKRTEQEVRTKFTNSINEDLLEDIIEYLKEANYLNDKEPRKVRAMAVYGDPSNIAEGISRPASLNSPMPTLKSSSSGC